MAKSIATGNNPTLGRRQLLSTAGKLGVGALLTGPIGAARAENPRAEVPDVLDRSCELAPSLTPGPFYLDLDLLRRDITEGLPGFPMSLILRIVDASDCSPIRDAVVDIWHADALGRYSGIPGEGTEGETWMRGIQITSAEGLVRFNTVFPGWYTGRTTHFHMKILLNNQEQLTSQLFFEDSLPDRVYQGIAPYSERGPRDTTNQTDFGYTPELELRVRGRYAGLVIGVMRG